MLSHIAIVAAVSPSAADRAAARRIADSAFREGYVATPAEVCETRDPKGHYAKARAGIIKEFTGISDPYEVPEDADLTIDTTTVTPEEAAQQVLLHLEHEGFIGSD